MAIPNDVAAFERFLQIQVEGKTFASQVTNIDHELGFPVWEERDPARYAESIVASLAAIHWGEEARREPNGRQTFPDLAINAHTFEVKTFQSAHRAWAAAGLRVFGKAIQAQDDKYFTTYYVEFKLKPVPEGYLIQRVKLGHIWDFSQGTNLTGHAVLIGSSSKGTDGLTFIENVSRLWDEREPEAFEGEDTLYDQAVQLLARVDPEVRRALDELEDEAEFFDGLERA